MAQVVHRTICRYEGRYDLGGKIVSFPIIQSYIGAKGMKWYTVRYSTTSSEAEILKLTGPKLQAAGINDKEQKKSVMSALRGMKISLGVVHVRKHLWHSCNLQD
jgi:hypothetical protein